MFNMPLVEGNDPTAPMPQGMMSGVNVAPMPQGTDPTTSHGKYNGTVDVQGQPGGGYNGVVSVEGQQVQVSEGITQFSGKQYLVSDDGSMVVDQERKIVGYVQNGQFKPMDAQHAAMLEAKGITE